MAVPVYNWLSILGHIKHLIIAAVTPLQGPAVFGWMRQELLHSLILCGTFHCTETGMRPTFVLATLLPPVVPGSVCSLLQLVWQDCIAREIV